MPQIPSLSTTLVLDEIRALVAKLLEIRASDLDVDTQLIEPVLIPWSCCMPSRRSNRSTGSIFPLPARFRISPT